MRSYTDIIAMTYAPLSSAKKKKLRTRRREIASFQAQLGVTMSTIDNVKARVFLLQY